MLFQHPSLLWGLLTVAVPIALHFWHQQQAKPMPWAMLRWLETPNQPPKRGFRFDNWLLLLLRCLLLIVLALLLARPSFTPKNKAPAGRKTHLVEPAAAVVEAYRFELEQALGSQERLFWATTPRTPITALTDRPTVEPPNPLQWQTAINELAEPAGQLHTYLTNSPAWTDAPRLHVPPGFLLHVADAPPEKPSLRAIALPAGKQLTMGTDSRLVATASTSANIVVATAPLRVLVQFRQAAERNTVRAALGALTTVYGLSFIIDNQAANGVNYAWILTDQPMIAPLPGTLYTLTGQSGNADRPNVTYVPEAFTPQTSERVASGELPEWLAHQLMIHLDLSAGLAPLPHPQLAALFATNPVATENADASSRNSSQTGLFLLFLGLLLTERYLASQQQA